MEEKIAMIEPEGKSRNRFFCSWSGGKDSCLALYRAITAGHTCASLFSMLDESGEHSRSHGLSAETLTAQAESLGMRLCTASASWDAYEAVFRKQAVLFRGDDVVHGVFGDIDLDPHRQWVERVCAEAGITPHLPLWKGRRRELVQEFIGAGFKAVIVVVDTRKMPAAYLGRTIDAALVDELETQGIDACGENGEFHTLVYDGPLFKKRVPFTREAIYDKDEYSFLSIALEGKKGFNGGCA